MDPETTPLMGICIHCLALEADTDYQKHVHEMCSTVLDFLAGLEMIVDETPTSYPQIES